VLAALLQISRSDSEWVVRYAGVVGLQALARLGPTYRDQIIPHLQSLVGSEEVVAVQARAQWAVDQLQAE
jgi:phycocyanobilin lyase beta subunit